MPKKYGILAEEVANTTYMGANLMEDFHDTTSPHATFGARDGGPRRASARASSYPGAVTLTTYIREAMVTINLKPARVWNQNRRDNHPADPYKEGRRQSRGNRRVSSHVARGMAMSASTGFETSHDAMEEMFGSDADDIINMVKTSQTAAKYAYITDDAKVDFLQSLLSSTVTPRHGDRYSKVTAKDKIQEIAKDIIDSCGGDNRTDKLMSEWPKFMNIIEIVCSEAFKCSQNKLVESKSNEKKYKELLERNRHSQKGFMEEITKMRTTLKRNDIQSPDFAVSADDISFFDVMSGLDDDVKDLVQTVVNERLRVLLEAPNPQLKELLAELYKGEMPWLGKITISEPAPDLDKEFREANAARQYEDIIENLRAEIEILNAKISELEQDFITAQEQHREEAEEIRAELQEAIDANSLIPDIPPETLSELNLLRASVGVAEARVRELEDQLEENNVTMEYFQEQAEKTNAQIEMLQTQVQFGQTSAAAGADSMRKEVVVLKETVSELKEEVKQEKEHHQVSKKYLEEARAEVKQHEKELMECNAETEKLKVLIEKAEEWKVKLTETLAIAEAEIKKLKAKLKKKSGMGDMSGEQEKEDSEDLDDEDSEDLLTVFERLFRDAVDKRKRMENLRVKTHNGVLKKLSEILPGLLQKMQEMDDLGKVDESLLSYWESDANVVKRKGKGSRSRSPSRSPKRRRPAPAPTPTRNAWEKDIYVDDNGDFLARTLIDGIVKTKIGKSSSMPRLNPEIAHPVQSVAHRQLRRSNLMKDTSPALFKLDPKDLLCHRAWEKKCKCKPGMLGSKVAKCPECRELVPSIGLGWCLPPLD